MAVTAVLALLAPLTLAVSALGPAPALAAADPADPVAGIRSITTARGSVAPECLAADSGGGVTVAALCFKEGADHSWRVKPMPGVPGTYVVRRGDTCLAVDVTKSPALHTPACTETGVGQLWHIAERSDGEYQLAQGTGCIQASAGEVTLAACRRGKDMFGNDDSGQAWKILKDPSSVVPDPTFGTGPEHRVR